MKKLLFTSFLTISLLTAFSAHIKGGFFTYEYLGPGISNPSYLRYKITLTVYMSCFPSPGQLTNPINFTIFQGASANVFANPSVSITSRRELNKLTDEPCISLDQSGCYYTVVEYQLDNYELPASAAGYTISYQRCCRIAGMENVQNSGNTGNTYSIRIIPDADRNSSPSFPVNDTAVVCGGSFFRYPFSATDKDGDALTYSLCSAFEGGSTTLPTPNPASSPPYAIVGYSSAYLGEQPMGPGVTINPATGMISGIAPVPTTSGGEFVVTVCVSETRGGRFLGETRKELHIQVKDCTPVAARLNPKGVTCDGFSVNFSNAATNPSGIAYLWEFGDPLSGVANSSSLAEPTHVYTDTGVYKMKLTVAIGGVCSNSDTLTVRVYPGFFPGFTTDGPLCKGAPVQFRDTTTTSYGAPTGWQWNFGNLAATNDTSIVKSPAYIYPDAGTYRVQLIVGNTFGCIDTVSNDVIIQNSPAINLVPHDTLICIIDTLQLKVANTGNVVWSPNYNISSVTSPNPLVSPDIPTKYFVTLTDGLGCINKDSVFIDVKSAVTINAGNDTTICRTDGLLINTRSDALQYVWTPSTFLTTDTAKRPFANPLVAIITYKVVGSIGKCRDSSSITIRTLPYPPAYAGADTTVCFGISAPLRASGGIAYQWSPATFLSATNIANPVATRPTSTTQYIVAVTDVVGCLKPAFDTVIVKVDPLVVANAGPSDTTVVLGEPLFLNATGGSTYLWQPATWLNNPAIANPIASPEDNITYHLLVSSGSGCQSKDSIRIKVYKVPPSFYVPTAFSPNNDSNNDILKPILLGMRSLNYFRVFNRWGNLLFYTSQKGRGWDGTFKGNPQEPGTYVWMAEGATFTGQVIVRKGYSVLVR